MTTTKKLDPLAEIERWIEVNRTIRASSKDPEVQEMASGHVREARHIRDEILRPYVERMSDLERAAQVINSDPRIQGWLAENDPNAQEQLREALSGLPLDTAD